MTAWRLVEAEAVTLARTAAGTHALAPILSRVVPREVSGHRLWYISSTTVGFSLVVTIDDRSATVVEIKEYGVR